MTREEKQKAIDALKISAPVMAVTQEEFNDYIQIRNQVMDWLDQQPCDDWHDVPSDEMTLEQARQAVKDLRKKLAEYLINQKATTCRHGGHCEWVACDKCNHYEPDVLNQQACEDAVSRQAVLDIIMPYCQDDDGSVENTGDLRNALDDIESLPPVTPKEKTGRWIMPQQDDGMSDPIYYQVRCSKCNFDLDPQTWNQELHQYNADKYCPNCGARMVSE